MHASRAKNKDQVPHEAKRTGVDEPLHSHLRSASLVLDDFTVYIVCYGSFSLFWLNVFRLVNKPRHRHGDGEALTIIDIPSFISYISTTQMCLRLFKKLTPTEENTELC